MRMCKAGALYFAVVFGAGFVLGPIRLFLLVPRLGARTAELLEMPVILIVMIAAARWVIHRLAIPSQSAMRLAMGGIALVLTLVAEFSAVVWLRGLSMRDYIETLDPVSGTAFYLMLLVFAILPLFVLRKNDSPAVRACGD